MRHCKFLQRKLCHGECSGFYSDGADEGITEAADERPSHVSYILLYVILISSRVYFSGVGVPKVVRGGGGGVFAEAADEECEEHPPRRRIRPKGEKKCPDSHFVIVWLLYECFNYDMNIIYCVFTAMGIFLLRKDVLGNIFAPVRR